MYSIKNLLAWNYWFSYVEPINKPALWTMIIFFGLMIIASIVIAKISINKKNDQPLRRGLRKLIKMLAWMGVIGFILLFFRYELVYILSRRFMLGLWFIGLVVWLAFAIRYFRKIPRLRQILEEQNRLKKYLP